MRGSVFGSRQLSILVKDGLVVDYKQCVHVSTDKWHDSSYMMAYYILYTLLQCIHCCSAYTVAVHTLLQCIHCCSAYTVAVHTLLQYIHCCSTYTVAVHTLLQCIHCCSAYTVAVYTLLQYIHCCSTYTVAVYTLLQYTTYTVAVWCVMAPLESMLWRISKTHSVYLSFWAHQTDVFINYVSWLLAYMLFLTHLVIAWQQLLCWRLYTCDKLHVHQWQFIITVIIFNMKLLVITRCV